MLFKAVEERHGEANALLDLGQLEDRLDRNTEARAAYTEARTLFKAVGERHGEAYVLRGVGDLERTLGRYTEARASYTEARMLYKMEEHRLGEAGVLLGLGHLEATLQPELARQYFFQAAGLFEAIGMSEWKEIALSAAKNISR
jgi:tetratricopeptide (TPR) repeat protein